MVEAALSYLCTLNVPIRVRVRYCQAEWKAGGGISDAKQQCSTLRCPTVERELMLRLSERETQRERARRIRRAAEAAPEMLSRLRRPRQ